MMHYKIPLKTYEEIKAFLSSHTRREITEEWQISYAYASQLCAKYGVKAKRSVYHTPAVDLDALSEYGKNHTVRQCAEHFGVSDSTISWYRVKYGIEIIYNRGRAKKDSQCVIRRSGLAQDMIKTLCATYTDASIARVFGYSKERIRQLRMEAESEKC